MSTWQGHFRDHAFYEHPRECCGLLLEVSDSLHYHPCRNIALDEEHFTIHPEDYSSGEDKGRVVAILHSHPRGTADPSQADRVGCEESGLPWGIMDRTGRYVEIKPSGFKAPLVGRHFAYGVLDCFSLVRDYYAEKLGIHLPDMPREGHWWKRGENKFEAFLEHGFEYAAPPQEHDIIVMRCYSKIPNHLGIYLGDGRMLHHPHDGLSCECVFRHEWQRVTAGFLRYAK